MDQISLYSQMRIYTERVASIDTKLLKIRNVSFTILKENTEFENTLLLEFFIYSTKVSTIT